MGLSSSHLEGIDAATGLLDAISRLDVEFGAVVSLPSHPSSPDGAPHARDAGYHV